MANLSHRITAASEKAINATKRIAVAERKIMRDFLDVLGEEESSIGTPPPQSKKNVIPLKTKPSRR
jgi:hypothetical protein